MLCRAVLPCCAYAAADMLPPFIATAMRDYSPLPSYFDIFAAITPPLPAADFIFPPDADAAYFAATPDDGLFI